MNIEETLTPYTFPVKETEVFHTSIDEERQLAPGYKAILRADSDKLVSIMKNTYRLVPNKDVIYPLMEELDKVATSWYIDDSHSFVRDNRMRLQITFPDLTVFDGRSEIALSLFLHNSYDGSEGIRMFFGGIRFICSNGMIFGRIFSQFYGKHTAGIDTTCIKTALEKSYELLPALSERIEMLQHLSVTKELREEVKSKLGKKAYTFVEEKEWNRPTVNQWLFLNLLTNYISHNLDRRLRASYQMQISRIFGL